MVAARIVSPCRSAQMDRTEEVGGLRRGTRHAGDICCRGVLRPGTGPCYVGSVPSGTTKPRSRGSMSGMSGTATWLGTLRPIARY